MQQRNRTLAKTQRESRGATKNVGLPGEPACFLKRCGSLRWLDGEFSMFKTLTQYSVDPAECRAAKSDGGRLDRCGSIGICRKGRKDGGRHRILRQVAEGSMGIG